MTTANLTTTATTVATPAIADFVNPFRERLERRRIERANRLGGLHRTPPHDATVLAEETGVALARDAKLLRGEIVSPF